MYQTPSPSQKGAQLGTPNHLQLLALAPRVALRQQLGMLSHPGPIQDFFFFLRWSLPQAVGLAETIRFTLWSDLPLHNPASSLVFSQVLFPGQSFAFLIFSAYSITTERQQGWWTQHFTGVGRIRFMMPSFQSPPALSGGTSGTPTASPPQASTSVCLKAVSRTTRAWSKKNACDLISGL